MPDLKFYDDALVNFAFITPHLCFLSYFVESRLFLGRKKLFDTTEEKQFQVRALSIEKR